MILKSGEVPVRRIEGSVPRHEIPLSRAGALTRMSANITILAPGETSSVRHWHEEEDEILVMLEGEAVVVEEDGEHPIGPGDVCCWPAGVANAHHVLNRSAAPVRYFIAASDPSVDHVHYPDEGHVMHHVPPRWWVEDADGNVLRGGETD